ncbi:hypothetical protein W97_09157 [Coniosporium apollinis CBS 100218]|uniref:Uncharacterized protein n=1 Tax=Coniosporium apollinis (strain CBS 100218) TaxID=1168221 RepID=R7Z706_CONA1|nr:uncharacterized protein W97_09157 [Coniosporium apollinis CBS 100218]EON69893.1 hypothetical protein W97_09157 [Coniosporium apollinis CBS 100218]
MASDSAHTFFGLWLHKYHRDAGVDREDASSQEGITASSAKKTESEADASTTQSPRAASKDQTEAEEEEKNEKREEDKRRANYDRHRNPLARFRARYLDFSAEVNPEYGAYETLCWTHRLATMAEIYLAGGVSGSHVNPVISLTLAAYRGFPWHKFRVYLVAQFLGSLTANGLTWSIYRDAILQVDPGLTEFAGKSFYKVPTEYISVATAFWSEFLAIAVQDGHPDALIIGLVVTMLNLTLGHNTEPSLNPMRDFATRLVALIAGLRNADFLELVVDRWLLGCRPGWFDDRCGGVRHLYLYWWRELGELLVAFGAGDSRETEESLGVGAQRLSAAFCNLLETACFCSRR